MHDLFFTVSIILVFLFLGSILSVFSRKINIPFSLALVLFGMMIYITTNFIDGVIYEENHKHGFLQMLFHSMKNFSLSPEVVFYLFLPTLLFESAFNLKITELKKNINAIFSLSIFSLSISVVFIALILHYLLGLPWSLSWLFGAIISATDPVAVLAIFKELGAPKRLRTIVEGESLFNDATGLVFFNIIKSIFIVGIASGYHQTFSFYSGFVEFIFGLMGGIIIGGVSGIMFSFFLGKIENNKNVEMLLAIILAHSAFLFSEHMGCSGIISTVVSGIVIGNYGRYKISPNVYNSINSFWDSMVFMVNILVFILIGISISKSFSVDLWYISFFSVIVVLLVRLLSVIPTLSFANLFTKEENKLPLKWQFVISHGGLRGALAVVMLLLIPSDYEYLPHLQTMVVTTIVFTMIFNGITMEFFLKKFGFMNFSSKDIINIKEIRLLVARKVINHLKNMYKNKYVSEAVYKPILNKYQLLEKKSLKRIHEMIVKDYVDTTHNISIMLRKHCWGIEKRIFNHLYSMQEISEFTLKNLLSDIYFKERELNFFGRTNNYCENNHISFVSSLKNKEIKIKKIFFFGFFNRFIENWKRKTIINKHARYRALRISAFNVFNFLESLKSNKLFLEENTLDKVLFQYKDWIDIAKEKQIYLENKYPKFLKNTKFYLTKINCYQKEKKIVEDFYNNNIITQKIFITLDKEIDLKIKKVCNNAIED